VTVLRYGSPSRSIPSSRAAAPSLSRGRPQRRGPAPSGEGVARRLSGRADVAGGAHSYRPLTIRPAGTGWTLCALPAATARLLVLAMQVMFRAGTVADRDCAMDFSRCALGSEHAGHGVYVPAEQPRGSTEPSSDIRRDHLTGWVSVGANRAHRT